MRYSLRKNLTVKRLLVLAALLFALPAHAQVTIEWVTVGDPGNAGDPQESCYECGPGTTFGSVDYVYRISKYEVTNAQYAEFLNAVAATDTYWLYDENMRIEREGSPGSYTYSSELGYWHEPVIYVDFYDTLRFANWLHNGQPEGAQDSTTTEDGAYTIFEDFPPGPYIKRNAGARVFLPSEDEWYKAAYYDTGSASYFDYPAGTDGQTTCTTSGATPNAANCDDVYGHPTWVGEYTGSASPNGTFDQGGNVWEWNESVLGTLGPPPWLGRGVRGGSCTRWALTLGASNRDFFFVIYGLEDVGFRIASLPEPEAVPSMNTTGAALMAGLVFGIGIVGLLIATRRRRGRR